MAKEKTKIDDYAFLSDTQTGALVSRDGCVDWLCLPRFDSPACFASLLGDTRNGHWRFFPEGEVVETRRRYRGDSLILETEIEDRDMQAALRAVDEFHQRVGDDLDGLTAVDQEDRLPNAHEEPPYGMESTCCGRERRRRRILGRAARADGPEWGLAEASLLIPWNEAHARSADAPRQ